MLITQISIDLSGVCRFEYVVAKQGDDNSRIIQVTLLDNGRIYVIDNITTARVSVKKPDKTEVLADCIVKNNTVEFVLDKNILAVPGTAEVEIILTGHEGQILTSASFDIKISTAKTGKTVDSSSEFKSFKEALAAADNLRASIENAAYAQFVDGESLDPDGTVINDDEEENESSTWSSKKIITEVLKRAYPVGSIYISAVDANPANLFGGKWVRFAKGRMLVGVDTEDEDFSTAGKTGGQKKHVLKTSEMPIHKHGYSKTALKDANSAMQSFNISLGGGNVAFTNNTEYTQNAGGVNIENPDGSGISYTEPHENMSPYVTVYMWRRTA